MGIAYNTSVVRSGLVLALDAANVKSYPGSGTTWTDVSGNGFNGTLVGGVGYSSDNLGSLVFDGVDDRGTFTTPITSNSAQSYEVWTNAVSGPITAQNFGNILHCNNASTSTGNSYMNIGINSAGIYFAALNGAYLVMQSGITANLANVVHIALTWDISIQRMYVNGTLRVSQPLTVTPVNYSNITSFGDYRDSAHRPMLGNLHSIKVYNRALSAQEVQLNFEALRGRFGI